VLRTGPHVLEGIEIYKGRPIFYGIGSLFSDHTGRRGHEIPGGFIPFPPGGTESVVPVITYKSGKASMIRLTPIVMLDGDPATTGVPRPADPERGLNILKRLQTLSVAFGTTIAIEHGVGIIRIP
jgi:poly-gamma-glutamate capsule biosynthesis protein CapA/YwtB (metallophosphatase superfamily)